MREIGGQLPAWEELEAIKAHCKARGAHLHMDGARLWEAAAGMGRSPAELAAGFDSVYVSLYKGIGGMAGAVLAGSAAFVARAAEWFRRQGGDVYQRSPYVVAAAMQFDVRLAAMPSYFARTEWLYEQLAAFPLLRPNPARPQANMLHVHLPVSKERAIAIRDAIAREHGVWLFGRANHAALPESSYVEIYVGENLVCADDAAVVLALTLWQAYLATGTGPAGLSPL